MDSHPAGVSFNLPGNSNMRQLAQCSRIQNSLCMLPYRDLRKLEVHHVGLSGSARSGQHLTGAFEIARYGFFTENVFAIGECCRRNSRLNQRWRGNANHIDILIRDEFFPVTISLWQSKHVSHTPRPLKIAGADPCNFAVRLCGEGGHEYLLSETNPYHSNSEVGFHV